MGHRLVAGAGVAAVFVLVSVLQTAHAQQTAAVEVRDNEFVAAELTVTVGDTVEWTQTGMNPHSVTADDGSFDSHPDCLPDCMGQGETFTRMFQTAGDHRYYCKIHGGPDGQGMSGIVRVQAASEDEPTTTTSAPVVTSTTSAGATTTTAASAGEERSAPPSVEAAPATLPHTGPPVTPLLIAGAVLLIAGGLVRRVTRTCAG